MAQPKLTTENVTKELEQLKEKQTVAMAAWQEAWDKMNEADAVKEEITRNTIFFEAILGTIDEPIKAKVAYAKGLAQGRGVYLGEDPQKSLVELLAMFRVQDDGINAGLQNKVQVSKPDSPAVSKPSPTPPHAEKFIDDIQPKPKRKRRTKAEMEALRAGQTSTVAASVDEDVSTPTPTAALLPAADFIAPLPVDEEMYGDDFDDGDYDD